VRLGSPVSGSWSAWYALSAAWRRRRRVLDHEISARMTYKAPSTPASRVDVRRSCARTVAAIDSYGRYTSRTPVARPLAFGTIGCNTRMTFPERRIRSATMATSRSPAEALWKAGCQAGRVRAVDPSSEKTTSPVNVRKRRRTTDPEKIASSVADSRPSRSARVSPSRRSRPSSTGAIAISWITAACARPWLSARSIPSWRWPRYSTSPRITTGTKLATA
jgi:hypothetical protein